MKVIFIIWLICFVSDIQTKLNISVGLTGTNNSSITEIIHPIIDVIRRSGPLPLSVVVIQENCLHVSNELLKQMHFMEYYPTLTFYIYENHTLDLKEMFPDTLLINGIMGEPRVVFWFVLNIELTFWTTLAEFRGTFLGNPRTPYIIIVTSQDQKDIIMFKNICQRTWNQFLILNVVVIWFPVNSLTNYESKTNLPEQTIKTLFYNQFKNKGSFSNLQETLMKSANNNIFSDKLKDTYGYEIKITESVKQYGLKSGVLKAEYESFQIIKLVFNATLLIINTTSQEKSIGTLGNKTSKSNKQVADIYGNVFFKTLKNMYRSSSFIDLHCLKFMVPKSQRIPEYLNIILPFSINTWSLVLGALPLITLSWKLFRQDETLETKTLIETVRIFVSGATTLTSISFSQKCFVGSYLLLCVVLMGAYQGSLTCYLTKPHYYNDINTMSELIETDLAIAVNYQDGFGENVQEIFESIDPNDILAKTILKRAFFKKDIKSTLDIVAFNRTMAYVDNYFRVKLFSNLNDYYKDGYPLIHVMEECSYLTQPVFHFPHVSPFQDRLDVVIRRGVESGLPQKWFNDDEYEIKLSSLNRDKPVDLKPLNLGHVQTSFYILISGLTLSSISLICEILVDPIIRYRNRNFEVVRTE